MQGNIIKYFLLWGMTYFVCSCAHYKDIPYFQNSAEYDGNMGAMHYDMTVKPKDKLTIFVLSGNDREAVAPFNIREYSPIEYENRRALVYSRNIPHQYLVEIL